MWDSNLKARWDYENSIAFAREEAEERGMEKGFEIGFAKGIKIGALQAAMDIAKELKKERFPIDRIIRFTKLSVEDIEKL
jgi:predicted transposase/invertase (TIGR01784 family)